MYFEAVITVNVEQVPFFQMPWFQMSFVLIVNDVSVNISTNGIWPKDVRTNCVGSNSVCKKDVTRNSIKTNGAG
jgi:hypothetical protein